MEASKHMSMALEVDPRLKFRVIRYVSALTIMPYREIDTERLAAWLGVGPEDAVVHKALMQLVREGMLEAKISILCECGHETLPDSEYSDVMDRLFGEIVCESCGQSNLLGMRFSPRYLVPLWYWEEMLPGGPDGRRRVRSDAEGAGDDSGGVAEAGVCGRELSDDGSGRDEVHDG